MSRRGTRSVVIGISVLALVAVALFLVAHHAQSLYTDKLATDHPEAMTVEVGSRTYIVRGGTIEQSVLNPIQRMRILRVAYAASLAERSPLAALPGTDPVRLRTAAIRLEDIMAAYAEALATSAASDSATSTLALYALYPTRFLQAMADAEEARRNLIDKPSERTLRQYHTLLSSALTTGADDAAQFARTFQAIAGESPRPIAGIGGTLSIEALSHIAAELPQRLQDTGNALRARMLCLTGATWLCRAQDADLTRIERLDPIPLDKPSRVAATDVRRFFAAAMPNSRIEERPMIVLGTSSCIGTLASPYYFSSAVLSEPRTSAIPYFLNDIFFIPTRTGSPMLEYLKSERMMSYSYVNPLTFYHCPDVGLDVSDIYATSLTTRYIRTHPQIPTSVRPDPGETRFKILTSAQALTFLAEALPTADDPAIKRDLLDLALMFRTKSAGLDVIVASIADTQESHARLKSQGLPIDASPAVFFLAQSAFLTLFQTYNPSFSPDPIGAYRSVALDEQLGIARFSDFSADRRSVLLHDLKSFFMLERP